METIIMGVRLLFRRMWRMFRGFLHDVRLDALPPVPAILALLALAIGIPMLVSQHRLSAALSESLAVERLDRLTEIEPREAGPSGIIHAQRPLLHWQAVTGAASYQLRILNVHTDTLLFLDHTKTNSLLILSGSLEPGAYRYVATALAEDGRELRPARIGTFTRTDDGSDEAARKNDREARMELAPAAYSFFLAGRYAEMNSPDDVASALAAYLHYAPKGEHAELATRKLAAIRAD